LRTSEYFGEAAWRAPRRLDPLSAFMWRCGHDPMVRPGLILVVLLDRPPDRRRLVAGHEWATRMVPRLRERPVAPLLTPTMPVWLPDPEFDVARHLHWAGLPRPAGLRELLDLAEELAAKPFDANRPPWESVLVEDLCWEPERYRSAWLVKFHHCLADGPALALWLRALLSRGREPRTGKPRPAAPPWRLDSLSAQMMGPVVDELAPTARRISQAAFPAARSPVGKAIETVTMARRLLDVATRPVGKPSPLLRSRGTTRRFEAVAIEFDGLRATARTAGVSVNAAYCAGLLVGLRHYHDMHGVTAQTVSAAITKPIQEFGPRRMGNRFNGAKFAGPLTEMDPQALCRAVDRSLAQAAPPFSPSGLDTALTCVNQLPTAALTRLARNLGRSIDLQISQVVAPGRDAYVSGARIERVWCFGPAPGCAAMALLVSRRNLATIAMTLDTAAIPDPSTFLRCVEEGFAELVGSHR
jgi:diacylglycerol O-acyltransferase / wax synthase